MIGGASRDTAIALPTSRRGKYLLSKRLPVLRKCNHGCVFYSGALVIDSVATSLTEPRKRSPFTEVDMPIVTVFQHPTLTREK
jgi:hypothetical protein